MKLNELKALYASGKLSKADFVAAAYKIHLGLFDYISDLKSTNVAEVIINSENLIVRLSEPAIKLICPSGDLRTVGIESLNFGNYEKTEFNFLSRVVAKCPAPKPVFMDIGANIGFYTLGLSIEHPTLQTLAFEPIPSTFAVLQKNIALNNLKEVRAFNLGISERQEEVEFHTYTSQSGASSRIRLLESEECTKVICKLDTMDHFCETHKISPDIIKCDVEGAELFVFKGGVKTISKNPPIIFCEMLRKWSAKYNYHPNDIINLLKPIGYDCFFEENGLNKIAEVDENTKHTNFFFLHREKHDEIIREFSAGGI